MSQKSCTSCKRITTKERCSVCNNPTSSNWSGLLIIIDPESSDIAGELNINLPGEYSLRVR
ncbi:transcription elongation factor subunit Spt4 [Methanobrevibacter filiformis]|uniref:Transcription elongation factor Spt4 n=1 Tax=Methanobrevibacter filiformis TaxID=55758 RepID=A0A162FIY5_9EURY|nr:transcription elongation factor subunit Spt4 [Methanobrevibacter filiformis]KZX10680.1 DNA-directed RNA polymerase subunit E'' [Methanobrevibacter filiformis]